MAQVNRLLNGNKFLAVKNFTIVDIRFGSYLLFAKEVQIPLKFMHICL